ncbi:GATA transcription factor 8 [Raphanus sativus]|uniref:GATA transcription factor n=1 Tax=Raphanus sativus TaxID=3726 RepID=A0A6J0NGN0_RAPSA|nr:GATA transcription factor 8 [Raphanus sativus]KAJ4904672.1 GATA transcription factor 8 [Raphanus sativus]
MFGQSFPEDLDCGNFFDNMDDILDFPGGDIDVGFGIGDSDSFPNIWTSHNDTWPAASNPLFSSNTNSDTSPELYVPFEDIVKVERPQSVVEESLVEKKEDSFPTNTDSSSSHSHFRSSSPVSVLESSSSSSHTTNTTSLVLPGKPGRPRTKRPRPQVQEKDRVNENAFGADSRLIIRIPTQFLSDHSKMITKKKKKKAKVVVSSSSWSGIDLETNGNKNVDSCSSEQNPVRKCMHCEVTKTPQWRLGPMGPKTLCNACGVRYKSGRLFPEYRPASSPTFTPALHSNSHKKVAEMRNKRCSNVSYTNEENDLQDLVLSNAYIGIGVGKSQRVGKF